jgi:hypothetical protein
MKMMAEGIQESSKNMFSFEEEITNDKLPFKKKILLY